MSYARKRLQKILCKKVYKELQAFKEKMFDEQNDVVIANAYKIVCMINIYEVFCELTEQMNIETLRALIKTPCLLEFFYSGWLDVEDSFQEELRGNIIAQIAVAKEYERRTKCGYEKISNYN